MLDHSGCGGSLARTHLGRVEATHETGGVVAIDGVPSHLSQDFVEVKAGRVGGALCARVGDVAARVQPLRAAHGLLRRHAHRAGRHLQQLHRVQPCATDTGTSKSTYICAELCTP